MFARYAWILWIIFAIIGLVVYMAPSMCVRRMYEGFAAAGDTGAPAIQAPKVVSVPNVMNDTDTMLRNVEALLNSQMPTPELDADLPSPTASAPVIGARGAIAQPKEYETTRSQPQPTRAQADPSRVLAQGQSFQSTKPVPRRTVSETQKDDKMDIRRINKQYPVYVPRRPFPMPLPTPVCPPPAKCPPPPPPPACPDMRNYIRKDSIPCWGCKLN